MDTFETPVTVTPQHESSKTLNSSEIPQKRNLTFTFGEITFTFGGNKVTFGQIRFIPRDSRRFWGFWNFFCCWEGVLGLCGSDNPVGVFEKTVRAKIITELIPERPVQ